VRESLSALGVQGMTVTEVKGLWAAKGAYGDLSRREYAVSFLPKLKIEVAVKSEMLDAVIDAITSKGKDRPDRRRKDFRHAARAGRAYPHRRNGW
jgi:nitrogen regulatory protein P-II 2